MKIYNTAMEQCCILFLIDINISVVNIYYLF